jgi:pimeloyl-ACP methyl ester carboxylesterase
VTARLHQERIVHGEAAPARWLALTHGFFGAGSNWRSIARKLTAARPEWGVVLFDLRQHGKSEAGEPPHTIAACAADVKAMVDELGSVAAIAGHSFGGKVVLAARPLLASVQTWVLDASPSRGRDRYEESDNTVVRVLALMERTPRHWGHREDFVQAVVADGHDVGLARWLAMNLVAEPAGGVQLRLDLAALREMLASYYATDLWGALEAPGGAVEVVVATRASTVSAADRGRLAAAPAHVHVHEVPTGHWLHMEAPDRIVELFTANLPRLA